MSGKRDHSFDITYVFSPSGQWYSTLPRNICTGVPLHKKRDYFHTYVGKRLLSIVLASELLELVGISFILFRGVSK